MATRWAVIFGLLLSLLLVAACGGPSRFGAVEQSLSNEIGVLTYDQAVQRWGQPTSISRGKRLFTAYWLKERSGGIVKERLWLTFYNDSQTLRSYRYTSKPFD